MDVCIEEMEVETIRSLEYQSEDQQPATGCRNPLKRKSKDDDVYGTPKGQ
jgi:hypothetical protein